MAKTHKVRDPAVLFILIGWAQRYDGTEVVVGNHAYLKNHPKDNDEAKAFTKLGGSYYCCAGRGEVHEEVFDVVFVALDPEAHMHKVVGAYKRAKVYEVEWHRGRKWATISSKRARLIPTSKRTRVLGWPSGHGMRRWARRVQSRGRVHSSLLRRYLSLGSFRSV